VVNFEARASAAFQVRQALSPGLANLECRRTAFEEFQDSAQCSASGFNEVKGSYSFDITNHFP
jgi:hypothetical protein